MQHANVFGPLRSLSLEQLVHRQEQRGRLIGRGVAVDESLIDLTAIRMELERRIEARRPVS